MDMNGNKSDSSYSNSNSSNSSSSRSSDGGGSNKGSKSNDSSGKSSVSGSRESLESKKSMDDVGTLVACSLREIVTAPLHQQEENQVEFTKLLESMVDTSGSDEDSEDEKMKKMTEDGEKISPEGEKIGEAWIHVKPRDLCVAAHERLASSERTTNLYFHENTERMFFRERYSHQRISLRGTSQFPVDCR
ncbi:hypothetical protein PV326_003723 [Microctonus aethiopoides]|nr:hypothetical protein PV326_003723 [Microctonus aethiopoides]